MLPRDNDDDKDSDGMYIQHLRKQTNGEELNVNPHNWMGQDESTTESHHFVLKSIGNVPYAISGSFCPDPFVWGLGLDHYLFESRFPTLT